MPAKSSKLSKLQRSILAELLRLTQHVETNGSDFHKRQGQLWGVSIQWLRGKRQTGVNTYSGSDSAAFSRALRRLEERGWILRTNGATGVPSGPGAGHVRKTADQPHGRTDHVLLLQAGREIAETVKT